MFRKYIALFTAMLLVVLGVAAWFWYSSLTKGRVLSLVDGQLLSPQEHNSLGRSSRELRENGWYVFTEVGLPALVEEGDVYHGWLIDEGNKEQRYMGELFSVQDGKWSVTYTTQEDVRHFTHVAISQGKSSQADKPRNIVARWEFKD